MCMPTDMRWGVFQASAISGIFRRNKFFVRCFQLKQKYLYLTSILFMYFFVCEYSRTSIINNKLYINTASYHSILRRIDFLHPLLMTITIYAGGDLFYSLHG